MRTKQREIVPVALSVAMAATLVARSQINNEAARFTGTWRGNSVCVATSTACHDEVVVYRVQKMSAEDHTMISADKIVDGKAINMGSLEFRYDRQLQSWVCQYPQGVWRFKVRGSKAEGTLTEADGTLFRQVTLRKDR